LSFQCLRPSASLRAADNKYKEAVICRYDNESRMNKARA
jgi:hypothetical protein